MFLLAIPRLVLYSQFFCFSPTYIQIRHFFLSTKNYGYLLPALRIQALSNILKKKKKIPPKKKKKKKNTTKKKKINKNKKKKNADIFHISTQNIDCVYPKSMFLSRNMKNNIYPCKPQFCYIKVGFKGVKII